jgi:hypothetical protein
MYLNKLFIVWLLSKYGKKIKAKTAIPFYYPLFPLNAQL